MIDISALTYPEVNDLIRRLREHQTRIAPAHWAAEQEESRHRSKKRAENKRRIEAEALELFRQVKVGDVVRVIGIRNWQYPLREITAKQDDGFTGWQTRQLRDGSFQRGREHTSHMSNKIRELVKEKALTV